MNENIDKINMGILNKNDLIDNEVFDKFGFSACVNDLFLITGGKNNIHNSFRRCDEYSLKNRTGCYCTSDFCSIENKLFAIDEYGMETMVDDNDIHTGLRVVLNMDDDLFSKICVNKYSGYNDVYEVEFGEYIQYVAAHKISEALEDEFLNSCDKKCYTGNILMPTGKNYILFDKFDIDLSDEYFYGKNKYVRVKVNCDVDGVILSNGNKVYNGDYVWLKVSPVKWLIDSKNKKLISKHVLLSGLYPFTFSTYVDCYIKRDMFFDSLNKINMISMLYKRYLTLSMEDKIDFMRYIPCGCSNIMNLSYDEIRKLIDNISMYEYGYSKKLKNYYF